MSKDNTTNENASFIINLFDHLDKAENFKNITNICMTAESYLGEKEIRGMHPEESDGYFKTITEKAIEASIRLSVKDEELKHQLFSERDESFYNIKYGLLDNYIDAAFNVYFKKTTGNLKDKHASSINDAAYNKSSYDGYKDECFIVRFLILEGFPVTCSDESGRTPLHFMSWGANNNRSFPRIVRRLISAGADVNAKADRGLTPLMILSGDQYFNENMVRTASILLEGGADPHMKCEEGISSLDSLLEAQSIAPHEYREILINHIKKL